VELCGCSPRLIDYYIGIEVLLYKESESGLVGNISFILDLFISITHWIV